MAERIMAGDASLAENRENTAIETGQPAWIVDNADQPSAFQQARKLERLYSRVNRSRLTDEQRADLDNRLVGSRQEMNRLVSTAPRPLLGFVRDEIKRVYEEVSPAVSELNTRRRRGRRTVYDEPNPESGSNLKTRGDRVNLVRKALGGYQEKFWQYSDTTLRRIFGNVDTALLRSDYEGVLSYIAARVAVAVEKELDGETLAPREDFGDFYFLGIKRELEIERVEVERQRQRQRRNVTPEHMLHYNDWRRSFEFVWAENREELRASVFGWLEKFEKHLPNETAQIVHQEGGKWKANAIEALEAAAHELDISEKEPFFEELRNTIESYTNVLVGVKLLETDGGFEPYTSYLEANGHNFNGHSDAIMLGNAKSAIIQAFMARNHGAISAAIIPDEARGGTIEKPQAGDIEDFRGNIEDQAKLYAATHELYIKPEDFESRRNEGYGWDDEIEELLLVDSRGEAEADALTSNPVACAEKIAKRIARIGVFNEIKDRWDKEDKARDGRSFAELSPDERKEEIRFRIRTKMFLAGFKALAEDVDATTDIAEKDRKLWDWLKEYNQKREKQGHSLFYPSYWDEIRLKIDRPTKLIDRVLAEDELDAMIEEVGAFRAKIEVTGQEVELNIDTLADDQIKAVVENLNWTDNTLPNFIGGGLTAQQIAKAKVELFEDALFNKQQREAEAERAFNINRAYQKFLGVDARWGGMTIRDLNDNGDVVFKTIWEKAEEILKAKIDQEEAEIEVIVTAHKAALKARGNLTDPEIDKAVIERRRLLRRDSTFGATLALREIGIAKDLPIWNYYYYNDPQRIQAFAPLVGYTHNEKVELVDLLDRGRREMRAVFDYVADTYMDGRILIVRNEANADVELELDRNGNLVLDPDTGKPKMRLDASGNPIPKDFHQEREDRARVINEAGVTALREVFESRFMLSTSGGIEVVDLISKIGDLGIYDLLWEMGCKDFREFQGFIKRRDEVELRKQSFWNIRNWRDPITYAKRLRGAGAAIPYLRGGEVEGKGRKPGVLQEPMMGAYKIRDFFLENQNWVGGQLHDNISEYIAKNYKILKVASQDKLVEIGAGVLVTLIEYMDARRYVMNRAGLAPKNWKADNELIFKAYKEEVLRRSPIMNEVEKILKASGAETLGDKNLAYAIEGRTPLAVKFFDAILRTSTYHILVEKDQETWSRRGKETQKRMDEKRKEIVARGLPAEVQAKIDRRMGKLRTQGMSQVEIDERVRRLKLQKRPQSEIDAQANVMQKEINRLTKQHFDEQFHKEFYGEWSASFAGIA